MTDQAGKYIIVKPLIAEKGVPEIRQRTKEVPITTSDTETTNAVEFVDLERDIRRTVLEFFRSFLEFTIQTYPRRQWWISHPSMRTSGFVLFR